jgi:hypothetical protein
MRFSGTIRSVAIKNGKDGAVVITQIESQKTETPIAELTDLMGQQVIADVRSQQLRMFNVDFETGEIQA